MLVNHSQLTLVSTALILTRQKDKSGPGVLSDFQRPGL